jgi:hypothetical protein
MAILTTREAAEEFAQGDPFVLNGVVRNWQIREWDEGAMLLYALDAEQLGTMRIVEHFTVAHGKITRLREIHDTPRFAAPASP